MTKEKHIEEMANIVRDNEDNCQATQCPDCKYANCDATICIHMLAAETLYNTGYRKASDVAKEIFEEIENILDRHSIAYLKVGQICGEHYYDGIMQFDIAELKKKYTEGAE